MRPKRWKQDTPKMQAVALAQGVEGWLLNIMDGVSDPEKAAGEALRLLQDLKALDQSYLPEEWDS